MLNALTREVEIEMIIPNHEKILAMSMIDFISTINAKNYIYS